MFANMIEFAMVEAHKARGAWRRKAGRLPKNDPQSPKRETFARSDSNNSPTLSLREFLRLTDINDQRKESAKNARTRMKPRLEPSTFPRKTFKDTTIRWADAPPEKALPSLPSTPSLQSSDDLKAYDAALEDAIQSLQNDFVSGARQLADRSLEHLIHIIDVSSELATDWGELWSMMYHAAKELSRARPSMSAAITSCLLRALHRVGKTWNGEFKEGSRWTEDFAKIAKETLETIVEERNKVSQQLGEHFTTWLRFKLMTATQPPTIQILTLSNSSTIRSAISHALSAFPDLRIHLRILESRPRCEGADMAAHILSSTSHKDRLSIEIFPDCAAGSAVHSINVVLLGADRISHTGAVSNKIGSLAATICAKHHDKDKNVSVVVLSDSDKIAASNSKEVEAEQHPAHELSSAWSSRTRCDLEGKDNVKVFGEWFEEVPPDLVDFYVTESGTLATEDVEKIAKEVQELANCIFENPES